MAFNIPKRFMRRGLSGWKALGFKTYQDYINHWMWKKYKAPALNVGYCQHCGLRYNLNVHHKNYEHVGEEGKEDVKTLCSSCHDKEHWGKNGRS
jgi:5-methylcytosine-specific restriction endonuclease McrA